MINLLIESFNDPDFHKFRKEGIGGSDIGALFGVDPYKTALDVYRSKTDYEYASKMNCLLAEGHLWEQKILDILKKDVVYKNYNIKRNEKFIKKHYPYIRVNVDGILEDNHIYCIPFEIKTVSKAGEEKWNLKYDENGNIIDFDPPMYVELQCDYISLVTGMKKIKLIVFFKSAFQILEKEIIGEEDRLSSIKAVVDNFWKEHVVKKIPPSEEENKIEYEIRKERSIEGSIDEQNTVDRLKQLSTTLKVISSEKKLLEDKLKLNFGDNEFMYIPNRSKPIKYSVVETNRFDSKLFQADNPDQYKKYLTKSQYRRLYL